jgi:Rrf2 family transcriptional regulator, iron-sulfur cluster assembly transcription factor
MKLNRRAHYSVKAMLDLVTSAKERSVSVKEIAERQSIPTQFLEKILIDLRRADLVVSTRGVQGGYQLKRSPREISLGEILAAVGEIEQPLLSLANRSNKSKLIENLNAADQGNDSVTFALWQRLHQAFQTALFGITLEELYFDAQSWQATQGAIFMV